MSTPNKKKAEKKKAKSEAEAKKKAEDEELKAKADAEAKAKEEADAKRKADEEAKKKADDEAVEKKKAEDEAKAKADAEEKKKAEDEAEAKAKDEAEAKNSGGKMYICSKLACDNAYTTWHPGGQKGAGNDMPRKDRQVLIKGGTGVINKSLVTPHGVVTSITDDELKLLEDNCPSFNRHVKAGFLKVLKKDPSPKSVESMADDMPKDKSEQKTPSDVKKKDKK